MSAPPLPPASAERSRAEPAGRGAAAARTAPAGREARPADPERAMRTCPNCGRELAERGCKLRCPEPACGYFLSCAEYH